MLCSPAANNNVVMQSCKHVCTICADSILPGLNSLTVLRIVMDSMVHHFGASIVVTRTWYYPVRYYTDVPIFSPSSDSVFGFSPQWHCRVRYKQYLIFTVLCGSYLDLFSRFTPHHHGTRPLKYRVYWWWHVCPSTSEV